MSTPAKTIRICAAGHIFGYSKDASPPKKCPDCGKPWQDPPNVKDPQHRDLLAKQKAA